MAMAVPHLRLTLILEIVISLSCSAASKESVSLVGDPGMRRDGLRVAFEGWNFCNEVGSEAPWMGSPRQADCFDYSNSYLHHLVTEADNKLGVGTPFPGITPEARNNSDKYAAEKELYLGSKCQVSNEWQFWMVMLKNGNFDTTSGLCPENGKKASPFNATSQRFPCFGRGCMNQPLMHHQRTELMKDGRMRGGFFGTYERELDIPRRKSGNYSFMVVWEKKPGEGSWVFKHKLRTSKNYPWLMLYLRADATKGFSGGYHYPSRGMLKALPTSPNFNVTFFLNITRGGGPNSQFYLMDIGSCWKNNGTPCDGDVQTDVTRYSEMIINPETVAWCSPTNLRACPPYHITLQGKKIYRNSTNFPYGGYHYYCSPGNAEHLEEPVDSCDAYSNPQAQEILQLLPHPIWSEYGFPSTKNVGWVGDPKKWNLNVGGLSSRLYFYQDPHTQPAKRIWTSIDVGTEIFISETKETAEWTLSEFDVIAPTS